MPSGFTLIIPTYNGAAWLKQQQKALAQQTLQPDEILIIDSGSNDGTAEAWQNFGAQVHCISIAEFNHGGTRRWASEQTDRPVLLYLTQDALPQPDAFRNIIRAFDEHPRTGLAYGRQLPHDNADLTAKHSRQFNYPANSQIKSFADAPKLGIKTCFSSDSFAAYRKEALTGAGGFPEHVIGSEDAYVAAKMLLADWQIEYVAEACVQHSHNYTPWQELKRYFDIGVFYGSQPWITDNFGKAGGEGKRFVLSEITLLRQKKCLHRLPEVIYRTILKFIGYNLGNNEKNLPLFLKKKISMHTHFWDNLH